MYTAKFPEPNNCIFFILLTRWNVPYKKAFSIYRYKR